MRVYLLVLLPLLLLTGATAAASPVEAASAGEAVYRQGRLPSGAPLQGTRAGGGSIEGAAAACVNCHRRSGLGTTEGSIVIPPIIGKYLFRSAIKNNQDMSLPHVAGLRTQRQPYDDVTLARAIREGLDPEGRPLNYLMPRFALDDTALASLIAYLKDLTSAPVPGVSDDTLHFATIITPDADPVARQGMLDVLERFFADKNEFIRGGDRRLHSAREIMFRVQRRWQLHVWQLSGAPETWQQQLQDKLSAEPVFAVISGLGGSDWAPVHHFCEQAGVPCLLPNVDLPVVAEGDFYPVYFSRGVLLEADLVARQLHAQPPGMPGRRLWQVYRAGDVGEQAARALDAAAALDDTRDGQRMLRAADGARELARALREARPGDAVMLWLRAADLALLPAEPPPGVTLYVSGQMAGLERAPLPAAWRADVQLTYPVDLPELRQVRMNYPLGWFKIRRIPIVAERVQSDTYLACGILAETLNDMLDSFVRDYLVERVEVMLSHRILTGYYPRLGLAPGQRFASKGGYLARFARPDGTQLTAEGDWVVP
jgi:hypothetical protein